MEFKKQKPIYLQIADTLCERIVAHVWEPDERLASVRDVAEELGVNPNTVMRTFDFLQTNGIIYNRRGVGYFVSPDAVKRILKMQRKYFFEEEWPVVRQRMQMLGISFDELKEM